MSFEMDPFAARLDTETELPVLKERASVREKREMRRGEERERGGQRAEEREKGQRAGERGQRRRAIDQSEEISSLGVTRGKTL